MATGFTPTYLIPYPIATDPVDVHGDMQDMADRVEDILLLKAGLLDNNLFTGNNTFSGTSTFNNITSIVLNSTSTALTIRQLGTGHALLIEDSANPDLTPFVVDNSGNVAIGKSAASEKLDLTGNANLVGQLFVGADARSDASSVGAISKTVGFKSYVSSTNEATITTTTNHGFFPGLMVDVALSPADPKFDGQVEITDVTPNTFTYQSQNPGSNVSNTASGGTATFAGGYTNPVATFSNNVNEYTQIAFRNSSNGANASTDFLAYADNGNDYHGWIDMGITSSGFNDPGFTITQENDGYIFMSAPYGTTGRGNLVLATDGTGTENKIIFAAGGLQSDNTQMEITPDLNVHIEIPTPSTSPSTGALTIVGGVGIQGDLYMAGDLDVSSGGIIARDELFVGADAVSQSENIGTNVKTASFKALSLTTATITTTVPHGYQPFQMVNIALSPADPIFDGTNIEITSVPTPTTFTFEYPLGGSVSQTATAGTVSAVTGWTNPVAIFTADADDYAQIVFQNINNGTNSSTDFIAYSDNGNDYSGWIDMGITSSTFTDPEFTITGPNDGYVFMRAPYGTTGAGNLVLATSEYGTQNKIIFAAGGLDSDDTQMEITPGVNVHVEIATPSTSPTTGAFTVVGGVGVLGDMNVQGNVNIAGTITFGGGGTTVVTDNLAVSDPAIFIGTGNASISTDLSFVGEYPVTISTITKSLDQYEYSIATEHATFRSTTNHTFLEGDIVEITNVSPTWNETFQVTGVPTATTFTVKKLGLPANIPPTAISPVGTATVSLRRRFYGISRDGADGIVKLFAGATTKPTTNVNYSDPTIVFAPFQAGSLTLTTPLAITSGGTGASTAQNARNNLLPAQSGNVGRYLSTDGTNVSWTTVDALPSQSGNNGKYLTTDGTTASWAIVDLLPAQSGNSGKFLTTNGIVASWALVSGGYAQSTPPTTPAEGAVWLDTDGTINPVSVDLIRWTQTVVTITSTFTGNGDGAFPLSYTPGTEQVFLNGVMLIRGSDYSAISGNSVVLVEAAVAGDILQVITLPAANLSNAVNNTLFTAKGDIVAAQSSGIVNRLGVGANNTYLRANSSATLGVEWSDPFASPSLTGTPTAPTAAATVNNTQIATTQFAQRAATSKAIAMSIVFGG